MNKRICESELFCASSVMLYGSFASTKYALSAGNAALPLSLLSAGVELLAILIISILPPLSGKLRLLALLPVPLCSWVLYSASADAVRYSFPYLAKNVLFAASLICAVYLAAKGAGVFGRIGILIFISGAVSLVILAAVYARGLDFSRLACGFSDRGGILKMALLPLIEVYDLYLFKGYFYCAVKDRSAKPPLKEKLSERELDKRYSRTLLYAWLCGNGVSLAVTVFLLSLAPSAVYAHAENAVFFGARLLAGADISPFISAWVYTVTLFRCTAALSGAYLALSDLKTDGKRDTIKEEKTNL